MDTYELLRRIRARGGQIRIVANAVQYRPQEVVTVDELRWLQDHREVFVRAIRGGNPMDADDYRRWATERFGLCDAVGEVRAGHLVLLPRASARRSK